MGFLSRYLTIYNYKIKYTECVLNKNISIVVCVRVYVYVKVCEIKCLCVHGIIHKISFGGIYETITGVFSPSFFFSRIIVVVGDFVCCLITISCIYLFLTPNSRSVFRDGVSLNIHSFIHSLFVVCCFCCCCCLFFLFFFLCLFICCCLCYCLFLFFLLFFVCLLGFFGGFFFYLFFLFLLLFFLQAYVY